MKLLHLADLHIGKIVNRFSMGEDQEYILRQVLEIADREKPEAVIIAGDIYDRPSPSAEAVALFDSFLSGLTERGLKVLMISGNHDSQERIAYASRVLRLGNVYTSRVYDGRIDPVILSDEYGEVRFYLLPFIRPAAVRNCFAEEIRDYTDAVRTAAAHMGIDREKRNVLIAHQFITGAELSGSEERSVGGTENVDVSAVEDFDYVALGHIHRAQSAGRPHVRYGGSLLKYSFDEAGQEKSVTLVEMKEKGRLTHRLIPLRPLRELRILEGSYREVMQGAKDDPGREDYVKVVLTDEQDIPDAVKRLRTAYPNILQLSFSNTRRNNPLKVKRNEQVKTMQPIEIVARFFKEQNDRELSAEQEALAKKAIGEIWGQEEKR